MIVFRKQTNVVFATVCLCFSACTLFETREAEQPSESGLQYLPQNLPEEVIMNLKTSLSQKDEVHYLACFMGDFVFEPTAAFRSQLEPWSLAKEQSYIQRLIAARKQPTSFFNLTLSNYPPLVDLVTREYQSAYALTVELADTTLAVAGELKFTLMNENSVWKISRWEDFSPAGSSTATWSALKARFP
jgi:hypothetical protein